MYQVNFKQDGEGIMIKCSNINNDNEKYSYKLKENKIIQFFGNITNFLEKVDDPNKIELISEKKMKFYY